MNGRILVIGSNGQIGTELCAELARRYGADKVIASDIKEGVDQYEWTFEQLDVLDFERLKEVIAQNEVRQVYLLAALLSATAEKNPEFAWKLNMEGLFNVLNLAKDGLLDKVFWPSSIAVFGPNTPKVNTPQDTIMQPTTVYGISKQAGENWCQYYHKKYGVDVRSIRYPGLIGYKSLPGGGTTDYAVDIFHQAIANGHYTCFLDAQMRLPMMYMGDAVKATVDIMEQPSEMIKVRTSYNLSGISFTPEELANSIRTQMPQFRMDYKLDYRNEIAASWPDSIDDSAARQDWGWKNEVDLQKLSKIMLENLSKAVRN
ncbi:NAD-dependent epimerase/dehydratase family protein [Parvicella tangerina]|uniref:Epimerase/dehydratase n=1 Tax=Parvicella tangerina TaxID=2829795 RepID=A0A916JPX8_9FLAO|nr:NAD-dependent epimerase/dehydratase family protein [Parvicella tangerina]CAG5086733.1 putative epimerase/dehydratase [Parvicella tangerina]